MKTIKELQQKREGIARRKRRVRARVQGAKMNPRLSVFLSNRHIYAQLIDDTAAKTIIGAGDVKKGAKKTKASKIDIARAIGKKIALEAAKKGIRRAVFDRGHYKYHGRARAVAEGAREGGLKV